MRLHLGCGTTILPDAVNVDLVALPGVDVVHDLDSAPWPWDDGTAENIGAFHLFEHLAAPITFMTECWRVLAEGGHLAIVVPYWKDPGAFTDPTHRRFCTENTFDYWIDGQPLNKVLGPAYGSPPAVFAKEHLEVFEGREIRLLLRKIT